MFLLMISKTRWIKSPSSSSNSRDTRRIRHRIRRRRRPPFALTSIIRMLMFSQQQTMHLYFSKMYHFHFQQQQSYDSDPSNRKIEYKYNNSMNNGFPYNTNKNSMMTCVRINACAIRVTHSTLWWPLCPRFFLTKPTPLQQQLHQHHNNNKKINVALMNVLPTNASLPAWWDAFSVLTNSMPKVDDCSFRHFPINTPNCFTS